MSQRIKLKLSGPVVSGALAFDLRDILNAITTEGSEMVWAILEFEGTGSVPNESIPEFEERIRQSLTGIRYSWSELVQFATGIDQTINCLIVGSSALSAPPTRDDHGSDSTSEVKIEAVDSSYWCVSTTNKRVAELLSESFRTEDVRDASGDSLGK